MPRGLCYVDVLSVSDLFGVPEKVEVPEEGRNFPNKMQFGQIVVIIIKLRKWSPAKSAKLEKT